MSSLLEIKIANKSDLIIVADLARRIWPISYKDTLSIEQIENMLEKIYSIENLNYEFEKLGHIFWVASENNIKIGYASAYEEDNKLWVKKLYILPEKQGRGYGSQLMNAITNHFNKAKSICLLVNSNNTTAQNFYKKSGFEVIKTMPVKMGDYDFIDFVMSKPLN